jgi:hypothetical protein
MVKNWQVGNSHARPAHPSILSPTAKTFQLGPLPAHPQPAPWVNPQSYLLHDRREILPTAPAARLGGIEAAPVPHPHFEQAQQGHLVGQPVNTSYVPNEGRQSFENCSYICLFTKLMLRSLLPIHLHVISVFILFDFNFSPLFNLVSITPDG